MIEGKNLLQDQHVPSIRRAATLLGVSRSGYYDWKSKGPDKQYDPTHDPLKPEIERIIEEFQGYGYRRVTKQLQKEGFQVNHKRILRIMRENGLVVAKRRYRTTTTDSDHENPVYPNLIRDLEITRPNQVWAADITYISIERGFVYLAAVLDLFTRRCIGWALRRDMRARLATDALIMAINARKGADLGNLIHHSDRGVQYTSEEYTSILKEHGIQISMSRKGNPYDNAYAESFFKTLKVEEVYLNEYRTYRDVLDNIEPFIEDVYT